MIRPPPYCRLENCPHVVDMLVGKMANIENLEDAHRSMIKQKIFPNDKSAYKYVQ